MATGEGAIREGKGETKKDVWMVLETREEESWNKRGTHPCLMLKQGKVRFIHSFVLQRFTEHLR